MAAGRFTPPLTSAKAWRRPLSQASITLPLGRRTCEQINMSDVSTFYRHALIGHRISCNAGFMDDVIGHSLSSDSSLGRRWDARPAAHAVRSELGGVGRDQCGAVGASSKVANLLTLVWRRFCPPDRSKAAFPEALSPEGRPNQIPQSNISAAISAPPKGKSNICPFFSACPPLHPPPSTLAAAAIIPKCPVGEIVPPRHLSSDLIN